jgi:transglutaminase-like putative cysteine protease
VVDTVIVKSVRLLAVPLLLAGMLTLAGFAADQVYSGSLLLSLLTGAAAASVLISVACARVPAGLVAPLSTLALAGYLAFALRLSASQAQIPGSLATIATESLRDGIPRLLAAVVPIEPQPDTVAVPILATWLAGLAATELCTRYGRTLLGLAPPTLLFGGALWLIGPAPASIPDGWARWPTFAFAALALGCLAITGRVRTPDTGIDHGTRAALRTRASIAGATGFTLVIVLALAIGPAVVGQVTSTPLDPRSLVVPPKVDALDENPLIRLSGWALQPQQRLMEANVDADTRIRLAVLSDYDGVTWRVGATYRPAGRTLPDNSPTPALKTVRQTITIDGLTGKLLPAVASPRQVEGVRVAYDQTTGTMIQPDGLSTGLRYTVTSRHDDVDVNLLPGAEVPESSAMARYLALGPGVPADIANLAQKLGADNGAAYQRASAIEQFLADHYRIDPQAPSGHAYPNLKFFLFGPTNGGGGKGTSEQFAASFALLARLLNLPSRVVVGFSAKAGTHPISAGDAFAWPEVYFADLGWVSFYPMPQPNQSPKPLEDEMRPKPETSTPPPASEAPVPTLDPSPTATASGTSGAPAIIAGPNVAVIAGASAGGFTVLLAAAFILVVLIARAGLRRRRLETGEPADRINGAWLEVGDALRLAGQPAAAHLSAAEITAHAADTASVVRGKHDVRLAAPPIDELAEAVNGSVFGPSTVDDLQAEQARSHALAYIEELKARRSWWRRLIWTLHPGPLRWHRND